MCLCVHTDVWICGAQLVPSKASCCWLSASLSQSNINTPLLIPFIIFPEGFTSQDIFSLSAQGHISHISLSFSSLSLSLLGVCSVNLTQRITLLLQWEGCSWRYTPWSNWGGGLLVLLRGRCNRTPCSSALCLSLKGFLETLRWCHFFCFPVQARLPDS